MIDYDGEEFYTNDVDEDYSLVTELLAAGVPRSRVSSLFRGRVDDKKFDLIAERFYSNYHHHRGITPRSVIPDIQRLIDEARAPEEFLDPLFQHVMVDPVVLSTGYIVDKSTALDKDGYLRFTRCPFSREPLKPDVYPIREKSEAIVKFKSRRDKAILEIARKLMEDGSYNSFHDVLQGADTYLKEIGETNYLPLMKELADIWTGVDGTRGDPPMILIVEKLNSSSALEDGWCCAVTSEKLQYHVSHILVSTETFKEYRRGSYERTVLAIGLYDEKGVLVERTILFDNAGNPLRKAHLIRTFGPRDAITAKASKGYTYKLEFKGAAGVGNLSAFNVEGWICKIFSSNIKVSSYRTFDKEDEEGLYMGQVNSRGKAHGDGSFEYDDGKRFVGKFHHGAMTDGVVYRGKRAIFTMIRGRWTPPPSLDPLIISQYPQNIVLVDSDEQKRIIDERRAKYLNRIGRDESTYTTESKPNEDRNDDSSVHSGPLRHGGLTADDDGSHMGPSRLVGLKSDDRGAHVGPLRQGGFGLGSRSLDQSLNGKKPNLPKIQGSDDESFDGISCAQSTGTGISEHTDTKPVHKPVIMFVSNLRDQTNGADWKVAMESAPLENEVSSILISLDKLNQTEVVNNKNSSFGLALYNARGVLVERVDNIFEGGKLFKLLHSDEKIVSMARPGSVYKLEYIVGPTGVVDIDGWVCKIFPEGLNTPFRTKDKEGDEGYYIGSLDSKGKPHSYGTFEYIDGKRFIGNFNHGDMMNGVIYKGREVVFTMRSGKWTTPPGIDKGVSNRFTQEAFVLDNSQLF